MSIQQPWQGEVPRKIDQLVVEKAGLPPLLCLRLLPTAYCPGAVFVSVPENPRFFISASVCGSRPRKLR